MKKIFLLFVLLLLLSGCGVKNKTTISAIENQEKQRSFILQEFGDVVGYNLSTNTTIYNLTLGTRTINNERFNIFDLNDTIPCPQNYWQVINNYTTYVESSCQYRDYPTLYANCSSFKIFKGGLYGCNIVAVSPDSDIGYIVYFNQTLQYVCLSSTKGCAKL